MQSVRIPPPASVLVLGPSLQTDSRLSPMGLYVEITHRLLVCIDCEVALTSRSAIVHFRTVHNDKRLKIKSEALSDACVELDIRAEFPSDLDGVPAIPGLRMFTDALVCRIDGCCKVYSTITSMQKHHRSQHPHAPLPSNWNLTFAQRLDHGNNNTLFCVEPPKTVAATPSVDWVTLLNQKIDELTHFQSLVPTDPRSVTPWLRSTAWPSHVAGQTPSHLRSLVAYPRSDEFTWLRPAMMAMYERSVSLIEGTPTLPLQKLNTPDPNKTGYNNTPFHAHQNGEKTLDKYIIEPVKLVAFLLRNRGSYSLTLPTSVTSHLERLSSLPPTSPISSFIEPVHDLLFNLWSTVWNPTPENTIGDPTICYLALSSIKEDGSWLAPNLVTPSIAKLEYCIRLTMLRQAHGTPENNVAEQVNHHLRWTTEKVESTFNSLRTIQHLASSFAYATTSLPSIIWTDNIDSMEFIFKGDKVHLNDIRRMLRSINTSTYDGLVQNVFLGHEFRVDYDHIADDLTNPTPGYSLFDDPRNSQFQQHRCTLIDYILANSSLSAQFIKGYDHETGKPIWNLVRLRQWYHDFCYLLTTIAGRIQFLGGSPARGTELTCLQLRNTPTRKRNLFALNKHIAVVCQYNKTTAISGKEKLIPHSLDAFTADVLVQSILIARPFAQIVALLLYPRSHEVHSLLHTHLFINRDRLLDTEHLSEWMKSQSEPYMGVSACMASWRTIQTAVRRRHCPEYEQLIAYDDNNESFGALQAGHSRSTENRIYGLSPDSFLGRGEDVLYPFLNASTRIHRLFSQPSGGQILPYTFMAFPSLYQHVLNTDPHSRPSCPCPVYQHLQQALEAHRCDFKAFTSDAVAVSASSP
ncbi:ATP-dependent DNA helicase tlh2 [Leucoagaricus sp. SymC.cos]|nr:ATP-dependent DNA helicase tlh2 [Leucoagaricus sp. SymC.cos]